MIHFILSTYLPCAFKPSICVCFVYLAVCYDDTANAMLCACTLLFFSFFFFSPPSLPLLCFDM